MHSFDNHLVDVRELTHSNVAGGIAGFVGNPGGECVRNRLHPAIKPSFPFPFDRDRHGPSAGRLCQTSREEVQLQALL